MSVYTGPDQAAAQPSERCGVTLGFYLLTPCGAPAIGTCPRCGRGMCAEHAVEGVTGRWCQNCMAELATAETESPLDPSWAARYRRRYRSGAASRFHDDRLAWSFDRYDTYYTDPGMAAADDWDSDDPHDIFDS